MHWWIDRGLPTETDLTFLCVTNQWTEAPVIAALVGAGFDPLDSEAWTYHVFAIHANGPGFDPTRKLTEAQWDRLTWE